MTIKWFIVWALNAMVAPRPIPPEIMSRFRQ